MSLQETPFDRSLFVPSWLVSAFNKEETSSIETSCDNWGLAELKALALVLSSLQSQCLEEGEEGKNSFQLNRQELIDKLGFCVFKKEKQILAFFQQLGGIRLYLGESEEETPRVAKALFYKETQSSESLELSLTEEVKEFILGLSSSFSHFFQTLSRRPQSFLSKSPLPLAFKRSLWLEASPEDLKNFIVLEKQSLSEENLAYLPEAFAGNLEALPLYEKTGKNREKSLFKRVKKLNNLLKKASFHGVSKALSPEEICWLGAKENKTLSLWQKKEPLTGLTKDLTVYYQRVNSYFLRTGQKKLPLFLRFFGKESSLSLYRQEIEEHFEKYKKDYAISSEGAFLTPFVFVFLELILRLECQDFPLEKTLKEKVSKLLETERNFFEHYQKFCTLYQEEKALKKETLRNSFLLNPSHPLCKTSAFLEKAESLGLSSHKDDKIKSEKEEERLSKKVAPQSSEEAPSLKNLIDPDVKAMITEALLKLKTHAKGDYQRIKNLYYNSLNEKSQSIIKTLEQRMNQDVFEHQLDQRLINFVLHNQGNPILGSLGMFSQNFSKQ